MLEKNTHLTLMHSVQEYVCAVDLQSSQTQTPSTGLQHPFFNHYHSWLHHRSYSSTNKTKIIWTSLKLFLTQGGCISCLCARNPQWEWKFGFPAFYMMPSSLSTSVDYQHSNRVLEETVFLYLHDTYITDNKLFSPKSRKNKPVTERRYVIRSGGP